jgi:predicted nucleotidyltransferase
MKKRNQGKKISLEAADRLFSGFTERLNRLPHHEEFGVAVPLVLSFGSYLRREPEVGDIDLAVLPLPKPNHKVRMRELNDARHSGVNIVEELYGPEKEVLQFLKNRSSWLALHEFSEMLFLQNLSFKVVHSSGEFQPLAEGFERGELTAEGFLKAVEELHKQLTIAVYKSSRQ